MSDTRTYHHNGHTSEIIRPDLSDVEVANTVRMLMRGDLDHEMVCCMARDRILCLTQENEKLKDRVEVQAKALGDVYRRVTDTMHE